eukprot:756246-Hanusia_phi.AAC.1
MQLQTLSPGLDDDDQRRGCDLSCKLPQLCRCVSVVSLCSLKSTGRLFRVPSWRGIKLIADLPPSSVGSDSLPLLPQCRTDPLEFTG